MLVAQSRPRNLRSYHAASLLFGDWGTSRLYVLGLAFYYTAHASVLFMATMSVLMVGVAWCYTLICRNFQEGGGVYAIARTLSRTLSVFGATLLLCNFTVTTGLSIVEGLHYFGLPHDQRALTVWLSLSVLGVIGLVNWFGARSAGRFALVVAAAAVLMSLIVALLSIPYIPKGIATIEWGHPSISAWPSRWQAFVNIVLALSGVEAVANMTGLMTPPVPRTAARTIWPVLVEVVLLNMVFGVAISGLPALVDVRQPPAVAVAEMGLRSDEAPREVKEYRDTALKVLAVSGAERLWGPRAGAIAGLASGVVFGLLLVSAANTAIMAMVSVLYSMARDKELPDILSRLNYSGVPWLGLLLSCAMSGALVVVVTDVAALADLYAIGVCGAITISILGCVVNPKLVMPRPARIAMGAVGMVMLTIEATIVVTKPEATMFAVVGVVAVLGTRQALIMRRRARPEAIPEPPAGWLAEVTRPLPPLDPRRPRIMLAARGKYQSEFAVDLARRRGAVLFAIYVRTLRVMDVQPGQVPRVEDDPVAQRALGSTAVLAREAGVPFVPIYVTSQDIAGEILDYTVTYGCDTLIMGKTRRTILSRKLAGDVVARVAEHLPDNVALLTRSADAPYVPDRDIEAVRTGAAAAERNDEDQAPPT